MVPRVAQLSLVPPDVCAYLARAQDDACDRPDIVGRRAHHHVDRRVSLAIGVDGAAVPSLPHVHRTAASREPVPLESFLHTDVAYLATPVLTSSEPRFPIPTRQSVSRDVGLSPPLQRVSRTVGRHPNDAHRARSTTPSRQGVSRAVGFLPLHTRVSRSVGTSVRNVDNKSLPFYEHTADRGVRTLQ